jgi:hypothetical protein
MFQSDTKPANLFAVMSARQEDLKDLLDYIRGRDHVTKSPQEKALLVHDISAGMREAGERIACPKEPLGKDTVLTDKMAVVRLARSTGIATDPNLTPAAKAHESVVRYRRERAAAAPPRRRRRPRSVNAATFSEGLIRYSRSHGAEVKGLDPLARGQRLAAAYRSALERGEEV